MPTPTELKEKFWKALKSDMTMTIGLDGIGRWSCPPDDGSDPGRGRSGRPGGRRCAPLNFESTRYF